MIFILFDFVYIDPVLKIQVLIEEKKPKNSNRISIKYFRGRFLPIKIN